MSWFQFKCFISYMIFMSFIYFLVCRLFPVLCWRLFSLSHPDWGYTGLITLVSPASWCLTNVSHFSPSPLSIWSPCYLPPVPENPACGFCLPSDTELTFKWIIELSQSLSWVLCAVFQAHHWQECKNKQILTMTVKKNLPQMNLNYCG